jgi:hypothetical protein
MTIERMDLEETTSEPSGSRSYDAERVDRLLFNTPAKTERYRTERFLGATGLNWYAADPTLRFMMRYQLTADELEWAEPRLDRLGALMGGPVSERADLTDKNPPRLIKYDRWGHDISEVLLPESALATKRDLIATGFGTPAFRTDAERAGVRYEPLAGAYTYLLCQAEIGMTCSLGADAGMVRAMVDLFAPQAVKDHVLPKLDSGEWIGKTGQFFTERTGGSDLGELETTATPDGDRWHLNGFKWFSSNCDGEVFVVLAKPEGAYDGVRGVGPFLVMKHRLDGTRNGMRIRQLKDKLGTKAVPSGEVEFVDAEAFLMAPSGDGNGAAAGDGHGLARLMTLTNVARVGIATMGLGCARRALVESLCYASARSAWKRRLIDQPLMRRKLAEMIVDVEAAQALVFDQYAETNNQRRSRTNARLRIGGDLAKLRCARLGITTASDAIEIHGGNGYVETWPVARILRDAQINTLWEGPDNILCLDVRRGIEREGADGPLLDRIEEAAGAGDPSDEATSLVSAGAEALRRAIGAWRSLDGDTAEARLYPLAQLMVDVYAGALLVEQAAWERSAGGGDRKALVARSYAQRHLGERGPLRGIEVERDEALDRFEELAAGAMVDERVR